MRRVCYITGTRADFGLMKQTLKTIQDHPALSLDLIATGMHLSEAHGRTIDEIGAAGLPVRTAFSVPLEPATGAMMARNIGAMTTAITDSLEQDRPDLVLLLGDRGEMLAGAIAGIHLGIPVAHVCGGERSGTVDEPVRHAVSKLSHLHFTSTAGARDRLIRMGENPDHIWAVGAPGLDGLAVQGLGSRDAVLGTMGLNPNEPVALLVYHPVLQEAEHAREHARRIVEVLLANGLQIVALLPNADAGSEGVRAVLQESVGRPGFILKTHLPRPEFIALMAVADLMAGNSSAGIVEAATFGTPVLNIGRRQNLRERNANVLDASIDADALDAGAKTLLSRGRLPSENVYAGVDGLTAAERIATLLATAPIDGDLLFKVNAY
jgi:GDP/UDP-N,N'-diacetylbacillosamine 2-epimerase (hydrolysing)